MTNASAPCGPSFPQGDEGDSNFFPFGMERKAGRMAGRKAKRALRKRMNPKQQPCCDRMPGPILDQLSRGVPKLPRGGHGLAAVSLRPSLAPHGTSAGVRESTSEFNKVASPRRPHTASGQRHQAGRVGQRGSAYGRRRLELSSSLPMASSCPDEIKPDEAGVNQAEVEDYSRVPEPHRVSEEWKEPHVQDSVVHLQISPLRPMGGRSSARQYVDAGQRTFRSKETPAPSTQGNSQTAEDDDRGASAAISPKLFRLEQDTNEGPDASGEDGMADRSSYQLVVTTDAHHDKGDEDAWSQPAQEDGRSATVVLSSTVLLSPRGRARTPTLIATDGPSTTCDATGWRAAGQGSPEDWAQGLSPRPHTAPDSCFGRGVWHDPPAAYNLPNTPYHQRRISPTGDVRQHMVSQAWRFGKHWPSKSVPFLVDN